MAQSESAIHIGAARIWMGVTAPASGDPPTWMTHTNGVPASGTEVGYTLGPAVFKYNAVKELIDAEQALGAIGAWVNDEECTLTFTAQERTYQALRNGFDNIGTVSDGSADSFYGGGLTITPLTQAIFLSSARRDVAAKWEFIVIYKAINMEGLELSYAKGERSTYEIQIRGLADGSRTIKDQIFQWRREK